jgi:hypothetical protein
MAPPANAGAYLSATIGSLLTSPLKRHGPARLMNKGLDQSTYYSTNSNTTREKQGERDSGHTNIDAGYFMSS